MADNDKHQESLQRLCRVCSNLIKNRIKKKNEHSSLFLTCFGIEEVEKEDCNCFPKNFCHNCYLKMKGTEKGKSTSLQLSTWACHKNQACQTCNMLDTAKKGGRKSKPWHPGRPKSAHNMTLSELMNLSPSKPIPKQVKEAVGHVVNIEAKRSTSKNRMITLPMKKAR